MGSFRQATLILSPTSCCNEPHLTRADHSVRQLPEREETAIWLFRPSQPLPSLIEPDYMTYTYANRTYGNCVNANGTVDKGHVATRLP